MPARETCTWAIMKRMHDLPDLTNGKAQDEHKSSQQQPCCKGFILEGANLHTTQNLMPKPSDAFATGLNRPGAFRGKQITCEPTTSLNSHRRCLCIMKTCEREAARAHLVIPPPHYDTSNHGHHEERAHIGQFCQCLKAGSQSHDSCMQSQRSARVHDEYRTSSAWCLQAFRHAMTGCTV